MTTTSYQSDLRVLKGYESGTRVLHVPVSIGPAGIERQVISDAQQAAMGINRTCGY